MRALAAIGDAGFGDLRQVDGIVLGDVLAAHDARQAHVAQFVVHPHLLMTVDHQIAVGQHLGDQRRQRHADGFGALDRAGADIGIVRTHLDQAGGIHAVLGSAFSRPKKLVRLALSELVRLREVVFCSLAVSATETFTVITSPTCMARGSWKKLCAPGCHSELLPWVIGAGRGNVRHDLGAGGIAHRRQLGGLADIFECRSSAEQADKRRAGQQQGGDFQEASCA